MAGKKTITFLTQLSVVEIFQYFFGVTLNMSFKFLKPSVFFKKWHHETFKNIFEIKEVFNDLDKINGQINKVGHLNYISFSYNQSILNLKVALRRRSSDFAVFNQVILKKEYDWAINTMHHNSPNDIIDAGGNIGLFSVLFGKHFPNSKIISLEPDNNNFEILKLNLNLNDCKNVNPLLAGLWSETKKIGLDRNLGDKREWAISLKEFSDPDKNTIQVYSLTDLLKLFHISKVDFLKIDIEGGEFQVFNAELNNSNILEPIEMLAVEIHESKTNKKSTIINFLQSKGYIIGQKFEFTTGNKSNN